MIETLHNREEFIAWMKKERRQPDFDLADRLQYPVSFSDRPWITRTELLRARFSHDLEEIFTELDRP
jgi:hypothetical protein